MGTSFSLPSRNDVRGLSCENPREHLSCASGHEYTELPELLNANENSGVDTERGNVASTTEPNADGAEQPELALLARFHEPHADEAEEPAFDLPAQSYAVFIAVALLGILGFVIGSGKCKLAVPQPLIRGAKQVEHVGYLVLDSFRTHRLIGVLECGSGAAVFVLAFWFLRDHLSSFAKWLKDQVNDYIPLVWRNRIGLVVTFTLIEYDQGLDGRVLADLYREGLFADAIVLLLIVLIAQLLIWAFLRRYGMVDLLSLARMLICPALSCLGFSLTLSLPPSSLTPWMQDASIIVSCLSLEPFCELLRCWESGCKSDSMLWGSIGEGILEASASGVVTIYITLVRHQQAKVFYWLSVLQSCVSMTNAAVELHYYGQKNKSLLDKALVGLFEIFPRILSRTTSLALVAFLTSQHWVCPFLGILLVEIGLNSAILFLCNSKITKPVTAVFSIVMLFIGPPGFLDALQQARLPQVWMQNLFLLLWAIFATTFGSFTGYVRVQLLWSKYRMLLLMWGLATLWSFIAGICTPLENFSLEERAEKANKKLYEAAKSGDKISCHLLIVVDGAEEKVANTWLIPTTIPIPRPASGKWESITAFNGKLYCGPYNEPDVLVIDPVNDETTFIPTQRSGAWKWCGIAACAGKLFCAPSQDSDVLVVDPEAGTCTFMPTNRSGSFKWCGIVEFEGKLYCAPADDPDVLVIDPVAQTISFIPTERSGSWKWSGITEFAGKLYCAPHNDSDVLVIDPMTEKTEFIPTHRSGSSKWYGIVSFGDKLYCTPTDDPDVLVIDPVGGSSSFLPTNRSGTWKWSGMVELNGKLYCAPWHEPDVLVVDPATSKAHFVELGDHQAEKWAGIAACKGKLYCAPFSKDSVLADASNIVDERHLLRSLGF